MAESSGELLGGRYRLLGERASFPFGAWWEAEDDQGARTVVLRMNPEVADPAAKAKAAVETTAGLDAAHIVAWADGGVDGKGHGWLAAPMFGPWSLSEHVSRGEGIPPVEAAPLVHQLARAVASAEAAGVQHNTLTSEFVRLVPLPDGGHGVKVYGYGLSDLLPSYKPLRKQDAYLGVPDYMSPELCAGKAAEGSSADIYAIGIIMYEAVRGRPPFAPTFASASASTTLKRHIFEKPLPLHVRYANAPFIKTYEAIAFKALAKTANRRHATVAELEGELEQLIVEEMRSQIVSLTALSGRGPTTSRRLRTQVIAQIPVDEPKVEVAVAPAAVTAAAPVTAQEAEPAAASAQAEVGIGALEVETPSSPRRGDSTLVFAGLGPAVREMAEAARKADEPEEDEGGGEDEEGETEAAATAAAAGQPKGKGKRKKGRKGSTGAVVVSHTAATQQVERPSEGGKPVVQATSVSSATVVTPKASEAATGERDAAPSGARAEGSGARIKKKDDAATGGKGKDAPDARSKDDEEWFSDDEATGRKSSRALILLLLAAAVVVIVVILLMNSGGDDKQDPPVGAATVPTASRYPLGASEPAPTAPGPTPMAPVAGEPSAPSEPPTPAGEEAKPEPAAAETPPARIEAPPEPAAIGAEAPPSARIEAPAPTPAAKVEPEPTPARVEAPAPTPAKVEPKPAAKVEPEPARVEAPAPTPTKVEPKPTPAKVEPEPAKVEAPAPTPTKVEPEPARVEPEPAPAKVDPPGSPEDQFRQKAKHYIELGIQAYKSENYKLAIGYFKKAQEADPSNAMAARYLKQATDKAGQ